VRKIFFPLPLESTARVAWLTRKSAQVCRGAVPPLIVVFVRPILYISPPIAFDKAGIVAQTQMLGCSQGIYAAQVRVTVAASYRQQVYIYVRLPSTEAEQPRALVGSPFDLDVLPGPLHLPASSIICGRVRGNAWPDACSDGVGFDLAMAGLEMELMVQLADRYYNPIFECAAGAPGRDMVQVEARSQHRRKVVTQGRCDAACPHFPYNQSEQWCSSCPVFETQTTDVVLRAAVSSDCDPDKGAYIVSFLATLAGNYTISLSINGSTVPETIYYRGPKPAVLDVLPSFISPSLSLAAGEEAVSSLANWTMRISVQTKDRYGNDRRHGVLHAMRYLPKVIYFIQDPSWQALEDKVSPAALCQLLSAFGCALRRIREASQRKYLAEGVSVGIAAGITSLAITDALGAPVPPSLFSAMAASPRVGTWSAPDDIGSVRVIDNTDGTFAVEYYFYQPGLYRIAIHGIGSDSTSSTQRYDEVDSQGLAGSPFEINVEAAQWHLEGHVNKIGRPMQNLARLCPRPTLPTTASTPSSAPQLNSSYSEPANTSGSHVAGVVGGNATSASNASLANSTSPNATNSSRVGDESAERPRQAPPGSAAGLQEPALAVGACRTWQSSESFGAVAARAVDGDTRVTFSAYSCTSTRHTGEHTPFWVVDLSAKREVLRLLGWRTHLHVCRRVLTHAG